MKITQVEVLHARFGRGIVVTSVGTTTIVRFGDQLQQCLSGELQIVQTPSNAFLGDLPDPLGDTIYRLQAEAIRSVNDAWGVFYPSRIDLYPHQLWVCKKVTEQWPARWVIADDVGLGKTIEAGLILWRLFHLKLIRRLLILCPASLVAQWQNRMLTMFDIRLAEYTSDQDREGAPFWKLHNQAAASFQTLRADHKGRHDRMLEAEDWDLILVDEAHHLNHDETAGMTLGHALLKKLDEAGKVKSILLFTGTPHRGKDFGFLALMALVRPDLFNPQAPCAAQLSKLNQALIRNNKYFVTDIDGKRLFQEPEVAAVPYDYSDAEDNFYRKMSHFIETGQAYANTLSRKQGQAVKLVLIALQKLASSSVFAIRKTLKKRLEHLTSVENSLKSALTKTNQTIDDLDPDDEDLGNLAEEKKIALLVLTLMKNERAHIEELIVAAEAVGAETKVQMILKWVKTLPDTESVLFFTEYKATQSLLLSSLMREFGPHCASFINGDEGLDEVELPDGRKVTIKIKREEAALNFNRGQIRFLLSTEAGGEGIDLQEKCHRLVHVDMPWNPMRMHQRVGRLNRIGQTQKVKVILFHNPATVEARIWTLLNEKLSRINRSINSVTESPEDLSQLVLGVADTRFWSELHMQAAAQPKESLKTWFDTNTGELGGNDAVRTVKALLGNALRFDYGNNSRSVPKMGLPDLQPFFHLALKKHSRKVSTENGRVSFITPDDWKRRLGVRERYNDVHFDRKAKNGGTVVGIGTKLFDAAMDDALTLQAVYACCPLPDRASALVVFKLFDEVTSGDQTATTTLASVLMTPSMARLLDDVATLTLLNQLSTGNMRANPLETAGRIPRQEKHITLDLAHRTLEGAIPSMALTYTKPTYHLLGIFENVQASA